MDDEGSLQLLDFTTAEILRCFENIRERGHPARTLR
jgi:hypothetical protein